VKKLISIGVALAVLAVVVLPLGAAAQCPGDYDGVVPSTYAKIPFAIIQSGFHLVGIILTGAGATLGLPTWINAALMDDIGAWAGGPLGWTVDMLGWGFGLVGSILAVLPPSLGIPTWLPSIVDTITCQIFAPWSCNVTGATFTPC
jgi:hypothetical protein